MREIKFRAWDFKSKQMFEVEEIRIKGNAYYMVGIIGFSDKQWLTPERNTIMQYTGLKDKNGKEIYEGDIMAIKGIDDDQEYYYEVYQAESGCWMGCNELLSDVKDNDFERCQVCGNIYENPNLLNQSK